MRQGPTHREDPGLGWLHEGRSQPMADVIFVVLVLIGFGALIAMVRGVERL
ncbi:MAG TPA: hypothetical protein VLB31_07100 [Actinomycetota bacterium]|nr:hypothetical protein [Actinomycetota bacterium]